MAKDKSNSNISESQVLYRGELYSGQSAKSLPHPGRKTKTPSGLYKDTAWTLKCSNFLIL